MFVVIAGTSKLNKWEQHLFVEAMIHEVVWRLSEASQL
jgi:hypothetical protein